MTGKLSMSPESQDRPDETTEQVRLTRYSHGGG